MYVQFKISHSILDTHLYATIEDHMRSIHLISCRRGTHTVEYAIQSMTKLWEFR